MKKVIISAIFLTAFSLLWAESFQEALSGEWYTEPFVMEQDSGLLTASDAEYSFPYRGIDSINFLDSGFIVFTVSGVQYRAFYEVEVLDFDNYHIVCNFKNGEEFILKLVKRDPGGWIYLYRISEKSVLTGSPEPVEEEAPEELMETKTAVDSDETELVEEAGPENLYTGILKRK